MTTYKVIKDFTHRLSQVAYKAGDLLASDTPADSIERLLNDPRGAFIELVEDVLEEEVKKPKPRTRKKATTAKKEK